MKKTILALAMAMLLSLASFSAAADSSGECGSNVTWTLTGTLLEIKGVGPMYDYGNYPESYPYPPSEWHEAEKLVIYDRVTNIGRSAFSGCSGLTSVSIPGSVASIGKNAFDGCKNLKKVNITDLSAWLSIEFGDYSNPLCNGGVLYLNGAELKDVVIPSSVTSIGDYAFDGYRGLTSVSIPSSVTSIGNFAFRGCTGLTTVSIPSSVTGIGGCLR